MSSSTYSYNNFNVTFPSQYVAQVEISRPAKLNAFVESMWQDIARIFNRLSADPDVRAILLTAAGDRAFTSGLDVQAASTSGALASEPEQATTPAVSDPARKAAAIKRHILSFQADISAIEACAKPVIAVMHGISFGLAIDMTACCDVRICAADARFAVKEVDIGLAADIGTLSRLPKAGVSMSWVKEVALSAREFGAEEALRVGFVSRVCGSKGEAVAEALELARLMASKSPVAVQATKEVINYSRDHSVADGLNYVAVVNASQLQTEDVKAAMMSGLQKRKPTFSKL
ncbi:hypothetical protein MBLNU230_g4079t1 [Neophaeotheca triangularis]